MTSPARAVVQLTVDELERLVEQAAERGAARALDVRRRRVRRAPSPPPLPDATDLDRAAARKALARRGIVRTR